MSWLPRISWGGFCSCESDDSVFEGVAIQLRWRGFLIEIAFARKEADDGR